MNIKVEGMSCQHCVNAVRAALEGLDLKNVSVDLDSGAVSFDDNPSVSSEVLKEAIEEEGFKIV